MGECFEPRKYFLHSILKQYILQNELSLEPVIKFYMQQHLPYGHIYSPEDATSAKKATGNPHGTTTSQRPLLHRGVGGG